LQGEYLEALVELNEAILLNEEKKEDIGNNWLIYNNRAYCLFNLERYIECN
jgi:hypothetical protein